ncbi:MAG: T9SS type A sorting domain-containing protein [Taibaiella sp.]|nr:T9SS type A sorting domain-containing protein [Taibaiella sp.]
MRTLLIAITTVCICSTTLFAQTDSLDINNINSGISLHGNMWGTQDSVLIYSHCEFPKGSQKQLAAGAAIWMEGTDSAGQLHVAAQAYGQHGYDYWPGPLAGNDSLTRSISDLWGRTWKVNRSDVNAFKAIGTHTLLNTPTSVLEWPAKGNPYAKGTRGNNISIINDMAPFIDVDGDGRYDPLKGDYPDIKGDQMIWWIFSDNGPAHNGSNGRPMKMEVHASAYAYNRVGMLQNIQYYEYNVINKGTNYRNYRTGVWTDMALGYPLDNYVGFDSSRRLEYIYNGASFNGTCSYCYGSSIPIAGISIIQMPGDASLLQPTGSFICYSNDFSPRGNPDVDTEYYNCLNARFRNGQHLHNDYKGRRTVSNGTGSGPKVNYIFNGDPADTLQWSECASGNGPGDRREVIATNDYYFAKYASSKFVFALVVTDRADRSACPNITLTNIKKITDSAWYYYYNTPPATTGIIETANTTGALNLYPNPANSIINVTRAASNNNDEESISVYDVLGRNIQVAHTSKKDVIELNISALQNGVFTIIYRKGNTQLSGVFVKN